MGMLTVIRIILGSDPFLCVRSKFQFRFDLMFVNFKRLAV